MKKKQKRNADAEFSAAAQQLAANLINCHENKGYRSFTICACSKAVETNLLIKKVAEDLGRCGWKTLLTEADLSVDDALSEDREKGLYEYLQHEADIEKVIQKTQMPGVFYLPGGSCPRGESLLALSSPQLSQQLTQLCEGYDIALFSAPSYADAPDAKLLASKTDCVILVVESRKTTFTELETAKKDLTNAGANILGVIITQLERL